MNCIEMLGTESDLICNILAFVYVAGMIAWSIYSIHRVYLHPSEVSSVVKCQVIT